MHAIFEWVQFLSVDGRTIPVRVHAVHDACPVPQGPPSLAVARVGLGPAAIAPAARRPEAIFTSLTHPKHLSKEREKKRSR